MKSLVIGLSPNITSEDITLSSKLLFQPWKYIYGDGVKTVERWLRNFFQVSYAITFSSARGALYVVLHESGIKKGDEVIIQAFTCVAVPNAVIATGATPVYADIDAGFNMTSATIERNITKKTKAIIVQHTFGIPAEMKAIMALARKHKLLIIEDCAHTIGGSIDSRLLGTWGDAAVVSFGRDKALSSVVGGAVLTNNTVLGKKIRSYQRERTNASWLWIAKQLCHPVITGIALKLYDALSIGKIVIILARRLGGITLPVSAAEKKGEFSPLTIRKYSNALAQLALLQLRRLPQMNKKRHELADIYKLAFEKANISIPSYPAVPLLRLPLIVQNPQEYKQFFRKKGNIYLGDWFSQVIDPTGVQYEKIGYKKGSCPQAEATAMHIINFPLLPFMSLAQANRITTLIREYGIQQHS